MSRWVVTVEALVRKRARIEVEADNETEAYEAAEEIAPTVQLEPINPGMDGFDGYQFTDCEPAD